MMAQEEIHWDSVAPKDRVNMLRGSSLASRAGVKMDLGIIEKPTLDQIQCTELADFLSWWLELEAAHGHPMRHHFTPKDLKDHLPHLFLVDFEPVTGRMKLRLVGTRIVDVIGKDVTGKYVDEMPESGFLLERGKWLKDNKRPYYAPKTPLVWAHKDFTQYEIVACPLFGEDGDVSMIILRAHFLKA